MNSISCDPGAFAILRCFSQCLHWTTLRGTCDLIEYLQRASKILCQLSYRSQVSLRVTQWRHWEMQRKIAKAPRSQDIIRIPNPNKPGFLIGFGFQIFGFGPVKSEIQTRIKTQKFDIQTRIQIRKIQSQSENLFLFRVRTPGYNVVVFLENFFYKKLKVFIYYINSNWNKKLVL